MDMEAAVVYESDVRSERERLTAELQGICLAGLVFRKGSNRIDHRNVTLVAFWGSDNEAYWAKTGITYFRHGLISEDFSGKPLEVADDTIAGFCGQWVEEVVTVATESDVILTGMLKEPAVDGSLTAPVRSTPEKAFLKTQKLGKVMRVDHVEVVAELCDFSDWQVAFLGRKRLSDSVRYGDLVIKFR